MPTTPKFDPAALGLTVETAGYRPASPETGEADTTHQIGYSKALPDGFTQHYGMNGEDLGISKDKSTWESVKPLVAMAGSALLPGVFNGLLGAGGAGLTGMGLSAGTGALTGGTIAGVTGGDPLRGALMGGLGSAALNALGQYMAPTQTGDMGQWYDGYKGPASDLGYQGPNSGTFTPGQNEALGNVSIDGSTANNTWNGPSAPSGDGPLSRTQLDMTTDTAGFSNAALDVEKFNNLLSQGFSPQEAVNYSSGTSEGIRGHGDEEIGGTGSNTSKAFPDGTPSVDTQRSIWDKLGDKAKETFTKADGSIDWSKAAAAAGLVTSVIGNLTASDPPGVTPLSTLVDRVKPKDFDTPLPGGGALTSAAPWNTRARTYAADMPSPIVAGTRGYAEGGEVEGALSMATPFAGFVQGEGGGQDDLIDASLSAGEYVFDAESVSMLGDGNNAEGAKKLDELRASLRAHKRSAPDDQIAPPAQGALSYMNGGQ